MISEKSACFFFLFPVSSDVSNYAKTATRNLNIMFWRRSKTFRLKLIIDLALTTNAKQFLELNLI